MTRDTLDVLYDKVCGNCSHMDACMILDTLMRDPEYSPDEIHEIVDYNVSCKVFKEIGG